MPLLIYKGCTISPFKESPQESQQAPPFPAHTEMPRYMNTGFSRTRLSINAHLLRSAHPSSLRRTSMYASLLRISRALHLDISLQPPQRVLFDTLVRGNGFSVSTKECVHALSNATSDSLDHPVRWANLQSSQQTAYGRHGRFRTADPYRVKVVLSP